MIIDDRLRLVFTCCHPALAREAQVALTLRLVCGLSTADIASTFLVSEPTMAARVTRAKKKIAGARIPYRVPGAGRAAGPPRRRADGDPPALHRRPHGSGRRRAGPDGAGRASAGPRPDAHRPDAGRARGPRPAGAHADHRRAARRAGRRRWSAGAAGGPGPPTPGTRSRSDAVTSWCSRRCAGGGPAGSPCRRRSPRCTASRRRGRRPTGSRSWACTTCCCGPGPRPSSRSTAASRWRWSTARRRRSTSSPQSRRTAGSRRTTICRRPRVTCCAGWAERAEAAAAYREAVALVGNDPERDFLARTAGRAGLTRGDGSAAEGALDGRGQPRRGLVGGQPRSVNSRSKLSKLHSTQSRSRPARRRRRRAARPRRPGAGRGTPSRRGASSFILATAPPDRLRVELAHREQDPVDVPVPRVHPATRPPAPSRRWVRASSLATAWVSSASPVRAHRSLTKASNSPAREPYTV